MLRDAIRRLTWVVGMALALLASSTAVQGDYIQPSQSISLVGEVPVFMADFRDWNASHGNLPLLILEMRPAEERGEMVRLLFWFWLQHSRAGMVVGGSPPFLLGPSAPYNLPSIQPPSGDPILPGSLAPDNFPSIQPPSGDPIVSPIGSIITGESGDGSPSPLSNGGDAPTAISGNFSSGPLPSNLPPQTDPVAVPEPATLTLLSIGTIGLLIGRRISRRMARLDQEEAYGST